MESPTSMENSNNVTFIMTIKKTIKTKLSKRSKPTIRTKTVIGEATKPKKEQKFQTYAFRRGRAGEKKFERIGGLQAGGEKVRSFKTTIVGRSWKAKPITIHELDPGAIITFHYRGPTAHDPQPIVMMLSRGFYRGKLHAMNLKYVPKHLLKQIQDYVISDPPIEDVHPRTYYYSKIKPFMKNILGGKGISTYRGYNRTGISNLKIYMASIMEAPY